MASDLIPTSIWSFPSVRFTSLADDSSWTSQNGAPSGLSVSEDDHTVYVEAAVPGVKNEDIDISFHQGVVRIAGEVRSTEGRKHHKRMTTSYSYQVVVPGEIDLHADPEAWFEDGVVSVAFPKLVAAKPKKIHLKSRVTATPTIGDEVTVSETVALLDTAVTSSVEPVEEKPIVVESVEADAEPSAVKVETEMKEAIADDTEELAVADTSEEVASSEKTDAVTQEAGAGNKPVDAPEDEVEDSTTDEIGDEQVVEQPKSESTETKTSKKGRMNFGHKNEQEDLAVPVVSAEDEEFLEEDAGKSTADKK